MVREISLLNRPKPLIGLSNRPEMRISGDELVVIGTVRKVGKSSTPLISAASISRADRHDGGGGDGVGGGEEMEGRR